MNEEKIYNCPRCKQKTLAIIDSGDYTEGRCKTCGYRFRDRNIGIIELLNKYSGICLIFFVILMLMIFMVTSGQFGGIDERINSINNKFNGKINDMDLTVEEIKTNINYTKADVGGILTRLSTAELNINSLTDLYGIVTIINNNISSINENITNLWVKVNSVTSEDIKGLLDVNLTFTHYANQTETIRYCHLDFSVGSGLLDIKEVRFKFCYDNVNISLINYSNKPQEYQYLSNIYLDNYYLYWFGKDDEFTGKFNITWNINNYNTSNLSSTGTKATLMVNSVFVDIDEIWEVEHV